MFLPLFEAKTEQHIAVADAHEIHELSHVGIQRADRRFAAYEDLYHQVCEGNLHHGQLHLQLLSDEGAPQAQMRWNKPALGPYMKGP